jgi:hypothetical protein
MHPAKRGEGNRVKYLKTAAIGLVLVVLAGVATGLLVARWYGSELSGLDVKVSKPRPTKLVDTPPPVELPPRTIPSRFDDAPAASPALR